MGDEKGLSKPERVEVGQRWRRHGDGWTFDVEEVTGEQARLAWLTADEGIPGGPKHKIVNRWPTMEIARQCELVSAKAKAPVMAEDARGLPVACLGCGGGKLGRYYCAPCINDNDVPVWLADDWDRGARDFPRPRARETAAEAPTPTEPAKSPPSASQGPQNAQWMAQAGKYSMQWADSMAARILGLHYRAIESAPMRVYLTPDEFVVPRPPAAPLRYEISVNGRDVLQYERLVDADPVESYPYWRVAGAMTWDASSPALVAAAKRLEFAGLRNIDVVTAVRMRKVGYTTDRPAPEPWRPQVLDEDLLCEDAGR